jgi:hypothetical protein
MTEVRAKPRGRESDAWIYEIFVEDEERWSGPIGQREARRLLVKSGYTEQAANRRLQDARRRHRSRAKKAGRR